MKITILAFFILAAQLSFGQDCKTMAQNKPGPLSKGLDAFIGRSTSNQKPASWDLSKTKPHLAKVESWIRNLLTGFTGAKMLYSHDYYFDHELGGALNETFYKSTGVKGFYGATTRFFAYYCYDNNNTIQTEHESGSFIYVEVNNVLSSQLAQEVGLFTVNGKPVFKVLEKVRTEGRIDYYDLRKRMNYNDTVYTSKAEIILIRNSDKPVFIPITRKEYLQQMLIDIEISRTKLLGMMTDNYKNSVKVFEAEMKAYKNDKSYTPEKEAKRRKWFNEDQEKINKVIQKIDPDIDASLELVKQYLEKPAEWLARGVNDFYFDSYTAAGLESYFHRLDNYRESKEDYSRYEMVTLNPAYYNKALGREVPQLLTVELVKNGYRYMYKLADLVKKPGVLAPLEAMLHPGKTSTPEIVTPAVSNYVMRYLPKLNSLAPLTVPADMKPSMAPVANIFNNAPPATAFDFQIPARSPKLALLPQIVTAENYKTYMQQLQTSISNSVQPTEKKKADDYVNNKKITQSKETGKAALAAWVQNSPRASLYLYSKAVAADPTDALTANNFSALLIMGGLTEKAIPILEYWNKHRPGEATLLCNLGNAYYRLGDTSKAMRYLLQSVQKDTLHPTANKILCMMYLKKGDIKKATDHGTKSITTSHDEQVISLLRKINPKTKPGEIMSRLHKKEYPLLKRINLPAMPVSLDDMDKFIIDLAAEKKSLDMTIESIQAKMPADDAQLKMAMANLAGGLPSLRVKAQHIIMDAMQIYQQEKVRESDVFKHRLKIISTPYQANVNAIGKKYAAKLNKLEGGEAGDEDQITALELARCKEINTETGKYLAELSPLVNEYAQRQEYIARKFSRDYANWAPYWMPQASNAFLSIERDFLKDISGILSEYKTVSKMKCEFEQESVTVKNGVLKEWEDEYCANFKGELATGPMSIAWDCNSWSVEGGEGLLGKFGMDYNDDGSFESFTVGAGVGESFNIGGKNVVKVDAGASVKSFIKLGPNRASGKWEVKDFGVKSEITAEAGIGKLTTDVKILEVSVAVNAGFEAKSELAPLLILK